MQPAKGPWDMPDWAVPVCQCGVGAITRGSTRFKLPWQALMVLLGQSEAFFLYENPMLGYWRRA
jgi:hypothetical protein